MYKVLVCDDEKDIVAALKIYLTSEGHQVLEAYNGKEAVEIVENQEVHLVIMDIMMPVMDGIQAMVKIREKSNVPVILPCILVWHFRFGMICWMKSAPQRNWESR